MLVSLVFLLSTPLGAQPVKTQSIWPKGTPTSVGLDGGVLAQLDADLAAGKYGYVDGMLIIRHGKLVYDRSYPHDYDSLYAAEARAPGPLNAHDPSGVPLLQSVVAPVLSARSTALAAVGHQDHHVDRHRHRHHGRSRLPSIDTPVLQFFDTTRVRPYRRSQAPHDCPASAHDDHRPRLERGPAVQ